MNKTVTMVLSLLLALVLGVGCAKQPENDTPSTPQKQPTSSVTATPSSQDASSVVSQPAEESQAVSQEASSQTASQPPQTTTVVGTRPDGLKYNIDFDIEDNVFMDALIYTGYNMEKHRADGNMWIYILSEKKRGLGYLSDITYGGGSSGLETTAEGLPDLDAFRKGGLVCASFATYVYFNYLPNVAGIDTSALARPERTYNAHSFYTAAKKWIDDGYSYSIGFTVSRTSYNYIVFKPEEEIPIGSIIVFEDDRKHDGKGSHITVYGGYKNGNHWVYQVGTSNGPEMCAIERMLFGPDPQWPMMVIATPSVLYQDQP